jgi:NADH:ubiquinone oxidoreductase subunit E
MTETEILETDYDIDALKEELIEKSGHEGALIGLLQATQERCGYIPEEVIYFISDITGTPTADIFGVITFYAQFRLTPMGKNIVRICEGTACHVNGAKSVLSVLQDELGISVGETTPDALFTLQSVACLGCCSLAPVIMINEETHGNLTTTDKIKKVLAGYKPKGKEKTA